MAKAVSATPTDSQPAPTQFERIVGNPMKRSGYRRIGHVGLHWYRPKGVPLAGVMLMRGGNADRVIGISGGVRWLAVAAYWLSPEWYTSDRADEAQRALSRD